MAEPRTSAVDKKQRPSDWPTQLTLPGQAAAPDGPLDLSVIFLVHHAMRRDLADFTSASARTPVEDHATWKALAKRWSPFGELLQQHENTAEAGLWQRLAERVRLAGDVDAVKTLEAIIEERREIDPVLVSCSAGFARMASKADNRIRAGLRADVVELNAHMQARLEREEHGALAIVQQRLTLEEWTTFEQEIGRLYRSGNSAFPLNWLLKGLPEEARCAAPAAPRRPTWQLRRSSFDRRERRAFRYASA